MPRHFAKLFIDLRKSKMKKKFTYLCAMAGVLCMFTACKDDDKLPGESLETKTYTEADGLTLNLDNEAVTGQVVTFAPDATAGSKGVITIAGAPLDLSAIIGGMMSSRADNQPAFALPTSSIIPGSASVSFPVDLVGSADDCTFEGTATADYCTFEYSGNVTKETMSLNISKIALKNTSMAGTYAFPELYEDDGWGGQTPNIPNILRMKWNSEKKVQPLPGFEMQMGALLGMAMAMPVIKTPEYPNGLQPAVALYNILKEVTLGADGSVTAKYVDAKDLTGTAVESPKGLVRYAVVDDHTLRLFIDPAAIIKTTVENASKSSRALDLNALIEGLMTQVVPMLANGVPVTYGPCIDGYGNVRDDFAATSFYLGTETLLPILKVVAPVLADEDIVNSIVGIVESDESMKDYSGMVKGILESLPEVIETTSEIELGINLAKAE